MAQILILEDEQPLSQSLSTELKRNDHECLLAENGREAFRLLEQYSPDLAILDVQLPDGDGISLLKSLSQMNPETFLLVITAYATVENTVEAFKAGAFDYLVKPVIFEDLHNKLQRLFQYR